MNAHWHWHCLNICEFLDDISLNLWKGKTDRTCKATSSYRDQMKAKVHISNSNVNVSMDQKILEYKMNGRKRFVYIFFQASSGIRMDQNKGFLPVLSCTLTLTFFLWILNVSVVFKYLPSAACKMWRPCNSEITARAAWWAHWLEIGAAAA